jgi:DNA repair photolyase
MNVDYPRIRCKTALSRSALPGLDYSLNPYIGCEHGCLYCYSPAVLRDPELIERWGRVVAVKENLAEVLGAEVMRLKKGTVGVSTVCDPYQPIERRTELTRRCLEILSGHGFDLCIQTKSDLVLRDRDLINPEKFEVGVTLITLDRELARRLEPKASPPEARVAVLEEFSQQGVETWIFLGPIIPEINDSPEELARIIEHARRTKSHIIYDKLNLRRGVLERLRQFLEEKELVQRISKTVARGSNWWRQTSDVVENICRELGVKCERAF